MVGDTHIVHGRAAAKRCRIPASQWRRRSRPARGNGSRPAGAQASREHRRCRSNRTLAGRSRSSRRAEGWLRRPGRRHPHRGATPSEPPRRRASKAAAGRSPRFHPRRLSSCCPSYSHGNLFTHPPRSGVTLPRTTSPFAPRPMVSTLLCSYKSRITAAVRNSAKPDSTPGFAGPGTA